MKVMDLIKLCDILSPKPSLVANTKERFQTVFGGIISMMLVILSVIAFLWFFILLFQKNDLSVILSNSFSKSRNFTFKSQERLFMFNAMTNKRLKIENQERILNITALNINYTFTKNQKGEIETKYNANALKVVPCTSDSLSQYASLLNQINYTMYYCLAPDQTIYFENTPQSTNHYYYFNVYYSPCVNSSANNNNCLDNETITDTLKNFYNEVIIMNHYFDHNNQTTPQQKYASKSYDPNSGSLFTQKYFYFQNFNYSTDNGIVFSERSNILGLTFYNSYYAVSDISNNSYIPNAFCVNVFQLQPLSLDYFRSYKRLQTVIGEIGGFINSLFLIAGFITNYISTKELHFHIFRNSVNLVDSKRIKKGKFERLSQVMLLSVPNSENNINQIVSDRDPKIQFENENDENKAIDFIKNSPEKSRRLLLDQSSNYVKFSVLHRIVSEDKLKMNFCDFFMSTIFNCYKKNNYLRDYYHFTEKKMLKMLDISRIIRIQNKLKYVMGTLFPDEKLAMNILSEVLFYHKKKHECGSKDDFEKLKTNTNENFERFLNNFRKKLEI